MSASDQHGSRDHSDRRRDEGERGGWRGREDRYAGGRRERRDDRAPGRRDDRGDYRRGERDGARGGYRGRDDRGDRRFEGRRDDRGSRSRDDYQSREDRGNRGFGGDRDVRRREGGGSEGYRGRNDRGSGGRERQDRDRRDGRSHGSGNDRRRFDERGGEERRGSAGGPGRGRDGYRGDSADRRGDRDARHRDAPRSGGFSRSDARGDGRGRADDRGGYQSRDHRGSAAGSGRGHQDDRGGSGGRGDRFEARHDRGGQDRHARGGDRRGEFGSYDRTDRRGVDDTRPRFVAPEIDADVTGRELDRTMHHELKALEPSNAERVSQHLVMAARYLDDDPEFALEHANAAVRKAGRIGVVREAAGVAAYAAGDYALALKELRTHRRISGSQEHLPLMVDCQRALGRSDKAMEEATSDAAAQLDAEAKAELAMVVSGIHADAGDHDAALAALEIPQLDKNRGFVYSPKLFRAYAEALRAVGRDKESMGWERQAIVAEAALGMGQFSEPEIVDLGDDLDEEEARRTVREAQRRHSAPEPETADRSEVGGSEERGSGDGTSSDHPAEAPEPTEPEQAADSSASAEPAEPAEPAEAVESAGPSGTAGTAAGAGAPETAAPSGSAAPAARRASAETDAPADHADSAAHGDTAQKAKPAEHAGEDTPEHRAD
ncbi:hypothetical protein M3G48_11055 [Kocuria rhizophila]|uniref:hypothetical protein n=1 Tax=Kocuria rhizophila TaxID=72000 RepID=UPI0021A6EB63|nr:hypothetical protein [Kocuria rhizophila]MCT1457828.1 hypothetical protein [Kocuria rhizophila]